MKSTLSPYIFFDGNCAEAMNFYKSIFGGELVMQKYGDTGDADEKQKDRIIHAELKNDFLDFYACDSSADRAVVMGDNIHMSIAGPEETQLKEFFSKLAEGGKVFMPLKKQFWGDTFGMLTDKFGIHWMVNISSN